MEFEGLQHLDELDNFIDQALARFESQATKAEKALFETLQTLISRFEVKNGNIAKTAKNIKLINEIRNELTVATRSDAYSKAVSEYLGSFNKSSVFINLYFSAQVATFQNAPELYAAMIKEYIAGTADALISGGLNGLIKPGITQILQTHTTSGAPLSVLRQTLKNYVIEDATLSRYARTVADNALNQFSRNMIQGISADLGLKYGFYKGTKIATSREFCSSKIGKYFTLEEALSWGEKARIAENAGKRAWNGVIKGTNEKTILIYLGGHACRHRWAPITEKLYRAKMGLPAKAGW